MDEDYFDPPLDFIAPDPFEGQEPARVPPPAPALPVRPQLLMWPAHAPLPAPAVPVPVLPAPWPSLPPWIQRGPRARNRLQRTKPTAAVPVPKIPRLDLAPMPKTPAFPVPSESKRRVVVVEQWEFNSILSEIVTMPELLHRVVYFLTNGRLGRDLDRLVQTFPAERDTIFSEMRAALKAVSQLAATSRTVFCAMNWANIYRAMRAAIEEIPQGGAIRAALPAYVADRKKQPTPFEYHGILHRALVNERKHRRVFRTRHVNLDKDWLPMFDALINLDRPSPTTRWPVLIADHYGAWEEGEWGVFIGELGGRMTPEFMQKHARLFSNQEVDVIVGQRELLPLLLGKAPGLPVEFIGLAKFWENGQWHDVTLQTPVDRLQRVYKRWRESEEHLEELRGLLNRYRNTHHAKLKAARQRQQRQAPAPAPAAADDD